MLAAKAATENADCKAFQFFLTVIGNNVQDATKNPLFQALKVCDEASQAVKVIGIKQSLIKLSLDAME